jgi:uncharacterized protein
MYLLTDTALVTSASDLKLAAECEFAFLRVLDHRLGWSTDPLPDDDSMLKRAAKLGGVHEERFLERYRAEYGDALVEFDRPEGRTAETLREYAARTREALLAGAPVVYQGVYFDETDPELPFVGYADFLVKQADGRYRVVDTKLSRHVRVTALLQLAAYHEQMQRLGVPVDDTLELILGNNTSETAQIDDVAPVFRLRRARMHQIIAEHRAGGEPVHWGDDRYAIDGRCSYCEGPAAESDDLITVAGMRLTQRAKLRAAGIRTLGELAGAPSRPGECDIPQTTFAKLRLQARLQASAGHDDPHAVPPFVVIDSDPIAGLPEPNPGDLFFDFEGDPMYLENQPDGTPRWGLDYLFGWVDANSDFDCLWAHSQNEERQALGRFLEFVAARRAQYPDMHIYHYASYEKTHLLSIAARHGEGEDAVDELLRAGVLVDLYPVVKASLLVGAPSYSIKKLEPLYMGEEERAGVTNAADSVDQYVESCAAYADGDHELAREIRESIAVYNAYDCRSTLKLRDWLRSRPEAHGVAAPVVPAELAVTAFEPSPLDLGLQALGRLAADRGDDTEANAYRLAAAAIDFHRRESKSFWWEHYDRLEQPAELWEGTRGVFTVEHAEVLRDWHIEGKQQRERRHLRLSGQWAPGSSPPRAGGDLQVVYSDPVPFTAPGHRPGRRVAHAAHFLNPAEDGADVLVVETRADESERWDAMPSHLAPGAPPPAKSLVAAIEAWGASVVRASPRWPDDAMSGLLLRRPPAAAVALEPMRSADDGPRAVAESLARMDRGYLAVQGPPGTGKTYLAAHVIQELVATHHWRIGVTAQSHKVVENVLNAVVVDAHLNPELVAKAAPTEFGTGHYAGSPFTELGADAHADYARAYASHGYVIGGTAWDFTNRKRVQAGQLDLLVIEEAGQFSLANTIAVATSAARILLLGDPQQLPQVSQGIHPAPVDASALGHLIGEKAVLPQAYGYFLEESRRMDEAVARPVSRLSYDGQLRSNASTRGRRLDGVVPGLHAIPVSHHGNSTSSPEEAAAVVELVRAHLGTAWTGQPGEPPRPVREADLIVVTPYNAQVELIRDALTAAGFDRVEVGTVDKFQGREAVIAIVSLAASSAVDVPRGMEFLLSRNRLNVSISRAKWAAYLIHSPELVDYLPATPDAVATLSRFITLVDSA